VTHNVSAVQPSTSKLYVIVRSDLKPSQQAVQACHAIAQFQWEHPKTARDWYEKSNTLALLALPNEAALGVMVEKAERLGIPLACFREPDRNNELTAIALGPRGKNLTRDLPLALQQCETSSSM